MPLLDLPMELLEMIMVSALLDDGFENLARSCKTLYRAGKGHLQQYNHYRPLRKKWRDCVISSFYVEEEEFYDPFDWDTDEEYYEFIASLPDKKLLLNAKAVIEAIAEEPIIGRFVEHLRFDCYPDMSPVRHRDTWERFERPENFGRTERWASHAGSIAQMIGTTSNLALSEWVVEGLLKQIYPSHDDGTWHEETGSLELTACLLCLLPNVRELELSGWWTRIMTCGNPHVETVMERLLTRSKDGHFSKLERLQCGDRSPDWDRTRYICNGGDIRGTATFLALPNLRTCQINQLTVTQIETVDTSFTWPYDNVFSSVENLDLVESFLDPAGISEILKHCPLLRSLRYEFCNRTLRQVYNVDWDPGAFVQAVADTSGDKLRYLGLHTGRHAAYAVKRGTGIVGQLKEFTALEGLDVDLRLFSSPPMTWHAEHHHSHTEPGECQPPSKFEVSMVRPIAEILPSSIKHVKILINDGPVEVLKRLFAHGADALPRSLLPELETMKVCNYDLRKGDDSELFYYDDEFFDGSEEDWPSSLATLGHPFFFAAGIQTYDRVLRPEVPGMCDCQTEDEEVPRRQPKKVKVRVPYY